MKRLLLILLFVSIASIAFGQKKAAPIKPIPAKEEKRNLPKRVYKSWMKIKASDENSSLTTRVFNSFFKSLKSDKEE
jgi:hypothetical protein